MSTFDQEICCHVSPLDKVEPEDDSFSCHMFSIEVVATFMNQFNDYSLSMEEEDYDESGLYDQECEMIQEKLLFERDNLLHEDEETSMSTIRQSLLDMDIPVQTFMVDRVIASARRMASNKRYMGRKVLHMRVEIDVPPSSKEIGYYDHNGNGDVVPTTMNALEMINVEDSQKQCSICLEEMVVGSEATRMPCSHVYHRKCILIWLEKSRACPLCRSEKVYFYCNQ